MRIALVGLALLVACGGDGGARRDLLSVGTAGAPDELDRLVARLPTGADRCSGARVGAVAAARRDGIRRLSALGGLASIAWGAEAPVAAYAEVRQEDPAGGRRPLYGLAHVSSVERMRAYLEAQRELHIRWSDGASGCPGPGCCPGPECWLIHAEALDAHTVRIRRGPWQHMGAGVEIRCAELARRFPEALEVASWTAADGLFGGGGFGDEALGFDVASLLEPFGSGLRRVEQYRLPRADLAEEIALLLQQVRAGPDDVGTIAEQTKVVTGDVLEIRTDVRWEDLELIAGDEARLREAIALEAAATRPMPLGEIDFQDVLMVREQVALRTEALHDAGAAERQLRAEELGTLLERAAEAHPGYDVFVEQLIEVLLGALDRPREAVAWTERVLARAPHDRRAWQVRRRRALARVGAEALAEALVDDGVVARGRAPAAAAVLASLDPARDYEQAEGAWLGAEALARVTPSMSRVRGTLPLGAVLETLLTLADDGGASRSVHIRVESAGDVGEATAAGAAFEWTERSKQVRAGAASTDAPDGAFRLLRDATHGLRGRVRAVLALTAIGGDLLQPDVVVAVEGTANGQELELLRASPRVAGRSRTAIRWERVGPLVGSPLGAYEVRLFPPPDLEVDLRDEVEAEAFLDRVQGETVLSCIRRVRREATVRCNASPQRDSTRRAWRRTVAPLVFR